MRLLNSFEYLEAVAKEGSIRKAAESVAITATALNRRILALETEIGMPLFERLPSGVRLNAAGELFLHHVRAQGSDLTRVLAQIADLSGLRRGQVNLSLCSEMQSGAIAKAIAHYRRDYPGVNFALFETNPEETLERLETFKVDIAFSFEVLPPTRTHLITNMPQTIEVAMNPNHPLAQNSCVRLHECRDYPIILPSDNTLRTSIDVGLMQQGLNITPIMVCNNAASIHDYLGYENTLAFHFAFARPNFPHVHSVPVRSKDLGLAHLKIYKIKGRVLPVPAAKFLDQIVRTIT